MAATMMLKPVEVSRSMRRRQYSPSARGRRVDWVDFGAGPRDRGIWIWWFRCDNMEKVLRSSEVPTTRARVVPRRTPEKGGCGDARPVDRGWGGEASGLPRAQPPGRR